MADEKKKSNPLLDLEIEEMVGGLAGQKALVYGSNSLGKALPNDSIIPTPDGYRKVGEINPGDFLFDRNGSPTKVLAVFPQGKKPVYEISFKDGRKVKCSPDHLWNIKSSKQYTVVTTKEIQYKGNQYGFKTYNIPLCEPVQYKEKSFPIPPYILGVFLGNGYISDGVLQYSSGDDILPNKIGEIMGWVPKKNSDKNYTYTFKDKDGHSVLSKNVFIGICENLIGTHSYDKFIPKEYLLGSIEQRYELLNGLMDTDGSTNARGGTSYTTTSDKLRDGMLELCWSLGMKADYSEDKRTEKYTSGHCYNMCIIVPWEQKPFIFTLEKHRSKIKSWLLNSKKENKEKGNTIYNVEDLGYETEMTCFLVDNPEHLFLCDNYIVTHNTYQAMHCERPLLLMTESGGNGLKGYKVAINSWADFVTNVGYLTAPQTYEAMHKKFFTVIIDTAENLVDLCEQSVCKEFGVRDLSEIEGKSNGYKIARRKFSGQINKLTSQGYFILFIAHEEIDENHIDELTGEVVRFIQPKGSGNVKSSMRMIRDICDFTIYLKSNGIDPETNETIMSTGICKQTSHVFARSRYAIQTFIDPFTAKNMCDAMEKAIKKSAENENVGLTTFKPYENVTTKEEWLELIQPYVQKLWKTYPEYINEVVADQLGKGRKISSATDDELACLESIYNNLVDFCCDRGIVVEV